MGCEGFERDLYARVDGELKGSAAERLEAHLAVCEFCRGVEAGIVEFGASLRGTTGEAVLSEEASVRIWEAVRSLDRGRVAHPRGIQIITPAPVEVLVFVIAALLIGAAAGVLLRPQPALRPASLSEWRGLPVSAFGGTYSQLMGKATLP